MNSNYEASRAMVEAFVAQAMEENLSSSPDCEAVSQINEDTFRHLVIEDNTETAFHRGNFTSLTFELQGSIYNMSEDAMYELNGLLIEHYKSNEAGTDFRIYVLWCNQDDANTGESFGTAHVSADGKVSGDTELVSIIERAKRRDDAFARPFSIVVLW